MKGFGQSAGRGIILFALAILMTGLGRVRADDNEAAALAAKIYWARPETNATQTGVLKLRDPDGNTQTVPVKITIVPGPTNWQSAYLTGADPQNAGGVVIVHTPDEPNQYFAPANTASGTGARLPPGRWMSPLTPGSDFWIADLGLEFFHWPQQRIVKKEFHRQCACIVLESTNPHPTPGGYGRVVSWIDEDSFGIVEAYAYDVAGRKLKNFYPKSLEKVNGQYQLQSMVMENVQTGSRSVFEFDLKK